MIKISVIVPVYCVEPWLRKGLESIQCQTLRDIEIICVDDGSTDASGKILSEYADNDSRIKIYHQKHTGTGAARNLAIENSCGEYIVFFDPDDYYPENDVLEVLYDTACATKAAVVGGRLSQFIDKGDSEAELFESGDPFPHYGLVDYRDYQSIFWFQCYIYRREFLNANKIRFPRLTYCEDPAFFILAMTSTKRFVAIDKVVYVHRMVQRNIDWAADGAFKQKDNLTGAILTLALLEKFHLQKSFFKFAKQTFKRVSDVRQLQYVGVQLRDIYLMVRSSKLISTRQKCHILRYLINSANFIDRLRTSWRFFRLPKGVKLSNETTVILRKFGIKC